MEITFSLIRMKEVINLYDGKRLGHIIDISFEKETGKVLGFIVPGIKRMFRKTDDIFIPLELVKKIGDDVILVRLSPVEEEKKVVKNQEDERINKTYARFRRVPRKEN